MSLTTFKKAVVVLLIVCPITTFSQSSKEIIANYRKAIGKMADEKNFQSMTLEGDFSMQKIELPAVMYFKSPNLMRMEMTFQNVKFLQVNNDTLEWSYNPLEDKNEIERRESNSGVAEMGGPSRFDYVNNHLLKFDEAKDKMVITRSRLDSLDVFVL